MKQVVRSARAGRIEVAETELPIGGSRDVLVRNRYSLLSAGTERAALEFDEKSLAQKARARPDLVRKVVARARRDGAVEAVRAALSKLEEARPLGYSCAGEVVRLGSDIAAGDPAPGTAIACAGATYANHAEYIAVPVSLTAAVPAGVALDEACYVTVAAIALHGVRIALPTLGERGVVIGCGLIGQIAVQLLSAQGVRVMAVDTVRSKVELAVMRGASVGVVSGVDDANAAVAAFTGGYGADFAMICAATDSSAPVALAAALCRDRGRVISVGATGLELPRRPFYDKELTFHISRSYGPGRYDPAYEEAGIDYPIGYIRWTEGRNFQAVLELIARGALNVSDLTTHRFPIDRAIEAYALIKQTAEPFMGVVLEYPHASSVPVEPIVLQPQVSDKHRDRDRTVSLLGAGAFARSVLLPAFAAAGAKFTTVASSGGLSATDIKKKFSFELTGDANHALADRSASIVIATRHDTHAALTRKAMRAGKNVFVEKPLAISASDLDELLPTLRESSNAIMMVGFNRRFAPATERLRRVFADVGEPLVMQVRVNAGTIPMGHWVQDPLVGGGRIVGEVCHFIDWMTYVAGALPTEVHAVAVSASRADFPNRDQVAILIRFGDGSVGSLVYAARGDTRLPKERFEVFAGERSAVIDDFSSLEVYRDGRFSRVWKGAQDKGHRREAELFFEAVMSGIPPIPYRDLIAVTRATFAIEESLRSGLPVAV